MDGLTLVYLLVAIVVGAVAVVVARAHLAPALKQRARRPLAYIFGLLALVSAGVAYVNSEPALYLTAAAMVSGVVSMVISQRKQQQ